MKTITLFAVCPFLLLCLTGCATPRPVLDLASQGVAITNQTEAELEDFVSRTHRLYSGRLQSIKRLASSNIEAGFRTEFENYTVQRAGMKDEADMIKLIKELSDFRAQLRENALKQQAQLEKTAAVGEPVKVPKEKIAEIRKAFAELSEELSSQEWLKFAFDFGKQVNESRKESKAKANTAEDKAATAAKALK